MDGKTIVEVAKMRSEMNLANNFNYGFHNSQFVKSKYVQDKLTKLNEATRSIEDTQRLENKEKLEKQHFSITQGKPFPNSTSKQIGNHLG
jgi:hypothetical protein